MNGAERLLETLVDSGVELCFANPGTSEMQLVSAIGNTDSMRAVLCLFEGVVSGAADGYARMADKPAITLLHVGSGFSNSMANQHNAKRAHVPLVNIVGDHATHHLQYDAPLTSDVPGHARLCSEWVGVSESADDLATCGARAVQVSMEGWGKVTTLVAPANHAWEESQNEAPALAVPKMETVSPDTISVLATALSNGKATALYLGGRALREESLEAAGRIARATGARILCETFPARIQRGAGRVAVERLPYFAEQAAEALSGFEQLVLVGARFDLECHAPEAVITQDHRVGVCVPAVESTGHGDLTRIRHVQFERNLDRISGTFTGSLGRRCGGHWRSGIRTTGCPPLSLLPSSTSSLARTVPSAGHQFTCASAW